MHVLFLIIYIIFAVGFCVFVVIFSYKNDPLRSIHKHHSERIKKIQKLIAGKAVNDG